MTRIFKSTRGYAPPLRAPLSKTLLIAILILSIFLGIPFAYRSELIGSDTATYIEFFSVLKNNDNLEHFSRFEPGFLYISSFLAASGISVHAFFFIVFEFIFLGLCFGFKNKSRLFYYPIWTGLFLLSFPFFYAYSLNIIRQGVAFVFVMYAIDRKIGGHRISALYWILLAAIFHYGSIIYLISDLLLRAFHRRWILFSLWIWLSFLTLIVDSGVLNKILNLIVESIGPLSHFLIYIDDAHNLDYVAGIKINQLIFSAIPGILIYIAEKNGWKLSKEGDYLFRLYYLVLVISLFFNGVAYNDRLSVMAWMLWPFIISPVSFILSDINNKRQEIFIYKLFLCLFLMAAPVVYMHEFDLI